jgi:hypothetical protein
MKDYANTETLVLLALLVGIALGTLSGYTLALDAPTFVVDNREYTQGYAAGRRQGHQDIADYCMDRP